MTSTMHNKRWWCVGRAEGSLEFHQPAGTFHGHYCSTILLSNDKKDPRRFEGGDCEMGRKSTLGISEPG